MVMTLNPLTFCTTRPNIPELILQKSFSPSLCVLTQLQIKQQIFSSEGSATFFYRMQTWGRWWEYKAQDLTLTLETGGLHPESHVWLSLSNISSQAVKERSCLQLLRNTPSLVLQVPVDFFFLSLSLTKCHGRLNINIKKR